MVTCHIRTYVLAYVRMQLCPVTHFLSCLHAYVCREQTDDGEVASEEIAEQYESRIAQQRAELEALMAQKEELLQLREMLRQLQAQEATVHTCTLFSDCVLAQDATYAM